MGSKHARPYRDEDWLRQKYVDEGLTQEEMAGLCDVSQRTISKWLEKKDVGERWSPEDGSYRDEAWLREKYHEEMMTSYEIADLCGASVSVICLWLRRHGIESRRDEYHRLHHAALPASLYTTTDGYEIWKGPDGRVGVHQLLAIADGAGPHEVFDPDTDVHHVNGLSWGNWHDNVEVLPHDEHARVHLHDEPTGLI